MTLNEVISVLDSVAEASRQTALESVLDGRSLLAIAYHISTIASKDRIIVVNEGDILEASKNSELLDQKRMYTRCWNRQFGDFIRTRAAAE